MQKLNAKMQKLIITDVHEQGRAIRSFDLMPEGVRGAHGIRFIPGQVAVLRVPTEDPAYFAFASAPQDPELEVLVKAKIGASTRIFEMQPGESIDLLDVVGEGFPLDQQKGRDLVFVAMG